MYAIGFALLVCLLLIAALRRPPICIAAVICMYGLEQFLQAKDSLFVERGSWVNIAMALVVGVGFGVRFWKRGLQVRTTPSFWITLAIFLISFFSFVWSKTGPAGREVWFGSVPYLLVFVGMAPFLVEKLEDLNISYRWTLWMGSLLAAALYFGTDWSVRGIELVGSQITGKGKVVGLTGAPLAIAELGGTIAIIAALMDFKRIPLWAVVKWLLVALGLMLAFRTQSRGQVLATFVVILIYFPISGRTVGLKAIVAGIFATIVLSVLFYVLFPMMNPGRWRIADRAMEGRLETVQLMTQDFLESPQYWLFGTGSGSSWNILGTYPHNVPVEVLYEMGFCGVTLMILFALMLLKRLRLVIADKDLDPADRRVLATTFALVTFFFAISLKQGSLYSSNSLFMFAILADRLTYRQKYRVRKYRLRAVPTGPGQRPFSMPVAAPPAPGGRR